MTEHPRQHASRPQRGSPSAASPTRRALSFGQVFARSDDPLTWSISLFSFRSFRVGVHWVFLFWVAAVLLLAIPLDRVGPSYIALAVFFVAAVVLLRELARLAVAHRLGVEPEYIPLWPLGSLLGPTLPRPLVPRLILVLTPTVVSLALAGTLAAALFLMGSPTSHLLFNPFNPRPIAASLTDWPSAILWWAYYANLCVAGLNLLPMTPLDGGRTLEAWVGRGARPAAARVVGLVGLLTAGALLVVGAAAGQTTLLAVALFGGLASWLELRRAEFITLPLADDPLARNAHPDPLLSDFDDDLDPARFPDLAPDDPPIRHTPSPAAATSAPRTAEPPTDDEARLDEVLRKISLTGMASLTDDERAVLDLATKRRRSD